MNKDLRRRQKKAKRAIRAAKRRVNVATKAKPPQFEPDLPMTQTAIEAEIARLLPEAARETPEIVEYGEHERTITLTPTMGQVMRLQKQLFRVVFRREPGPHDPLFWDRDREAEGVFPIDLGEGERGFLKALEDVDTPPEIVYAIALTGIIPVEGKLHLYKKDELERWEEAASDYVHQAETGIPPLVPDEMMRAVVAANDFPARKSDAVPSESDGETKTRLEMMFDILERELDTRERAAFALYRLAALGEIVQEDEFQHLATSAGPTEAATIAAASAEMDRKTRKFVRESFRERLKVASVDVE